MGIDQPKPKPKRKPSWARTLKLATLDMRRAIPVKAIQEKIESLPPPRPYRPSQGSHSPSPWFIVRRIPHQSHRYPTVGDWLIRPTADRVPHFEIRVSRLKNPDHDFLLAIHEMIEAYLCWRYGVTDEAVTAWDIAWKEDTEPGEDPRAPYYFQHTVASAIERYLALILRADWRSYERAIRELDEPKSGQPKKTRLRKS